MPRREAPARRAGVYTLKNRKLPSVTEVCSGLAKPFLMKWGAKVAVKAVFDDPDRYDTVDEALGAIDAVLKAAGKRGRAVHAYMEAWAKKLDAPACPEDVDQDVYAGYTRAWDSFIQSWKPDAKYIEVIVANWTHGYAGRMDLIVGMGSEDWGLDAKTAKAVYPEYPLQLKAYQQGEEMSSDGGLTWVPMPPFAKMGVVLLDQKGTFNLTQVDGSFEAFLNLLALHNWKKELE